MTRTVLPRAIAALASLAALVAVASPAAADSSAWVSVNGGVTVEGKEVDDVSETTTSADDDPLAHGETVVRSQLQFDVGVGTTPANPIIVGGLFRISPTIGEHTDFSLLLRGATEGFQTGPFGVAIDVGPYARADDEASVGLTGDAVLGGPMGLQLTLGGHFGSEGERGAMALLGVDMLRLTAFRESLLDWWPNPSRPDQDRHEQQARAATGAPSF